MHVLKTGNPRACTMAGWLVGGLFLFAAAQKAWAAGSFALLLSVLVPLPGKETWAYPLAAAVVFFEGVLGLALVFWSNRRGAWVWAGATLATFSVVLLYIVVFNPKLPGCGCLSMASISKSAALDAGLGLVRNAALIALCVWCARALAAGGRSAATTGSGAAGAAQPLAASRGFTIIEILVVILVMGVVMSITLPHLARARETAKDTISMSTMRQVYAATIGYAAEHNETLPYLGNAGAPDEPVRLNGSPTFEPYFRANAYFWARLIEDRVEAASEVFAWSPPPVQTLSNQLRTRYWLTCTAAAAPAYWARELPPTDLSLFRATRITEIAAPARKGLIIDVAGGFFRPGRRPGAAEIPGAALLCGVADGSARATQWAESATVERTVVRPFGAMPWPVMGTRGGLGGEDF